MSTLVTRNPFIVLWLCVLFAAGLTACSEAPQDAPEASRESTPGETAVAVNNRGVGLMGRFAYADAVAVFEQLATDYPDWIEARVNLAIATLNRQEEGDERSALETVERVLDADPGHLRAHYVAGLLRLYLGVPDRAAEHFRAVAEADPSDAYAAYYLGQCLAQQSRYEEALDWYRKALAEDAYLRSAYYAVFQTLRRLKRVREAQEVIGDYQRLASNPRARLAEFKYTRMGPKAEVVAIDVSDSEPIGPPVGEIFLDPMSSPIDGQAVVMIDAADGRRPASMSAADVDGDGALDLFIARSTGGRNLLLKGALEGAFQLDLEHPLAAVPAVNAALWADFDNDGLVDVYLCRRGSNRLWQQQAPGQWRDVTASSGTGGAELDTVDGQFFDADHDGDLDLFLVNADGANELLNNNLDGSFRPLAAEQSIDGGTRASRTIVPTDIDSDRDTDLIVINGVPPHEVYLNDRLWSYRPGGDGFAAFIARPALSALAADVDADGVIDLLTVTPEGTVLRWQQAVDGSYVAAAMGRTSATHPDWVQMASLDVDGDGRLDLLVADSDGWKLFAGEQRDYAAAAKGSEVLAMLPIVLGPRDGPSVATFDGGGLKLWRPGAGRQPFLTMRLSGMEDVGQSMRSNASGIGAQIAVRVDSRWTLASTFRNHSGPGQSDQPLAIGLGGAEQADFVTIDWSDGVFQSEIGLGSDRVQRIAETQRQLSSCPVLFVWDGERYAFVSDLLGVGGIGFALGPGEYSTPRPWENFLLPADALVARDGRFLLKITEPMEEVAYLDSVRLLSYDLPPGWRMVLDERMGILGPEPSGDAVFYRHELLPVDAVNDRGQRVVDTVARRDRQAAPVGPLDRRFIGRLQREHVLTLTFDQRLDRELATPVLMIDGWVEYPYSQTMFAAWQAKAAFDAPSLEAQGHDGVWRMVQEQFGYPAGMPRRMSLPMAGLPEGARTLRIRTNMEVYWDRIAVVLGEPRPDDVRIHELPLVSARLAQSGFARRSTGSQRLPHYDYDRRRPFWDTRYLAGFYTRFGPVEELVVESDDALAVIGPGEEVHLGFDASAPSLPAGWTRWYVLEATGWAKDMDLFTRDGETVAPLPHRGRRPAHREELHERYHTRYMAGRS